MMISDQQRLELSRLWLGAIREIGTSTQIPLVHNCWLTILYNGVFVSLVCDDKPSRSKLLSRVLLDPNVSYPKRFPICIWIATNEDPQPIAVIGRGKTYSDNWGGFYNSLLRTIVMKEDYGASMREKAAGLLHEAGHAFFSITEKRFYDASKRTTVHSLREESLLHYMESQLWKEWGSAAYIELLDEIVAVLQDQITDEKIWFTLPDNDSWYNVLATFLGYTHSDIQRDERMSKLKRFAHFECYDRVFPARQSYVHRTILMKRIYDSVNRTENVK